MTAEPGGKDPGAGIADACNLADLEALAGARLTRSAFDYYAGGAQDELTLGDNRRAFDRLRLAYRVLVDVAERDPSTRVLGESVTLPVLIAPAAFQQLADPEGEVATARAARAEGTIMVLSTLSNRPVEEVAAAAGPLWFQLYVYRDRAVTEALVRRVEAAGCRALVLTVDAPVLGRRERDVRNRFRLPEGLVATNLVAAGGDGDIGHEAHGSALATFVDGMMDASLSWGDLEWLAGLTPLPVLIKGVVRPDDALRAADHGAAGVVVSNHGGRQLDTALPTIDALPEIASALAGWRGGDPPELLLDGGVRRGTDVIKALAHGARAVLIGRPALWGLAAGGEAGVRRAIALLREELDVAMALCGCRRVEDVTADLVRPGW